MEKDKVVGWIGFLVIVLVILGIAGVVLGVSMLSKAMNEIHLQYLVVAAAIFFLQATVAFGFALRAMTR